MQNTYIYIRTIIPKLKESKTTIYLHSDKHTRPYKYCDACSQSETNIVDARWYSAHTQLTFLFLQDLISNSRYASVTPLNEIWIQICAFLLSSPGRSFHSLVKNCSSTLTSIQFRLELWLLDANIDDTQCWEPPNWICNHVPVKNK